MGCTWISVVNLAVLIFASVTVNMKATTQTSSGITHHDETIKGTTPVSTVSSEKQLSTDVIVTTNNPDCHLQDIESGKNRTLESSNCTSFENATTSVGVSTEINSPVTQTVNRNQVSYRDFSEYTHYKNLGRVSPYIANVPGFITNSFTILIATNIKPLHTSELYMIVLGCADLLAVTARFTFRMIELYLETKSSTVCKIIVYILNVSQVYSNMILVSWTIERFIAVMFPIKLASWCSIRNTKITAALLLLFCLAIMTPYLTESIIINIWNGQNIVNVCYLSEFMYSVWYHIESVYYIYLPMVLVCICNLTILCRLSSMTKARISMASNQETIDKKAMENRKMTILLLTIAGTFIFLHIPYAIALIAGYIYPDVTTLLQEDPHTFAKYLLYTSCGYIITEFQNCINFFLYCISGTKFRSTFRKIICKHIAVQKAETSQGSATRTTTF